MQKTGISFRQLCDDLKIDQPRWKELTSISEIYDFVDEVGFPVLIRPSYVLSGAAMNVVSNKDEMEHYLTPGRQGFKAISCCGFRIY